MKNLDYREVKEQVIENLKKKGNEDNDRFFPWEDVYASMENYPGRVVETDNTCPVCSSKCVSLYFRSPAWTWRNLMGRAGNLVICPNCAKQLDFRCHFMN